MKVDSIFKDLKILDALLKNRPSGENRSPEWFTTA